MKSFGIFNMSVTMVEGVPSISFTAIRNPVNGGILELSVEDAAEALAKASKLLKEFNVQTHSRRGNPETVMGDFPDYFVGEIYNTTGDLYDDASLRFRIHEFIPMRK
jgi:hypothetical protein